MTDINTNKDNIRDHTLEEIVDRLKSLREEIREYDGLLLQMKYSKTYIRKTTTILFWHWMSEEKLPYTLHSALREFISQRLEAAKKEVSRIERYLEKKSKS
jgi:nitrate reductase assembly molybdenum cofactor insertion protein NarJ